uniref:Uncharacterized protein n=1 Tax=Oryza barthii TaxID=65489 RepID=A0A0D3HUI6_9ORYZ
MLTVVFLCVDSGVAEDEL